MSTDYYIACKKCKVAIDVASWGLGGFQFYRGEPDCMLKLHALLKDHTIGSEHDIGLITEHIIYDDDYKCLEWSRADSQSTRLDE